MSCRQIYNAITVQNLGSVRWCCVFLCGAWSLWFACRVLPTGEFKIKHILHLICHNYGSQRRVRRGRQPAAVDGAKLSCKWSFGVASLAPPGVKICGSPAVVACRQYAVVRWPAPPPPPPLYKILSCETQLGLNNFRLLIWLWWFGVRVSYFRSVRN